MVVLKHRGLRKSLLLMGMFAIIVSTCYILKRICSSRECQIKDWPEHQVQCRATTIQRISATQGLENRSNYHKNDNSIFTEEQDDASVTSISHPPLVDWSKAFGEKKKADEEKSSGTDYEGKSYLHRNEFHTDLPELDEAKPFCKVTVKCNKVKHEIKVQNSWTGKEMFKFLSYSLKVPLENLKLIHKGKVLNDETISDTVKNKAVYQVIGEQAESEDGLDQRGIAVMMKQLGIDRNGAVKALKKSDNLIDAMLGQ